MSIRTKRIYDPPSPGDGYRLLVMRRWPRGIRKDAVDAWRKDLAPSEPLRRAYLHEDLAWDEFAWAYLDEMTLSQDVLLPLDVLLKEARRAQEMTVTLLCSCLDETRCHRSLLKKLMETVA